MYSLPEMSQIVSRYTKDNTETISKEFIEADYRSFTDRLKNIIDTKKHKWGKLILRVEFKDQQDIKIKLDPTGYFVIELLNNITDYYFIECKFWEFKV